MIDVLVRVARVAMWVVKMVMRLEKRRRRRQRENRAGTTGDGRAEKMNQYEERTINKTVAHLKWRARGSLFPVLFCCVYASSCRATGKAAEGSRWEP